LKILQFFDTKFCRRRWKRGFWGWMSFTHWSERKLQTWCFLLLFQILSRLWFVILSISKEKLQSENGTVQSQTLGPHFNTFCIIVFIVGTLKENTGW
jgi:hypothetical protein